MRVFHVRDDLSGLGVGWRGNRMRFGGLVRFAEIESVGGDMTLAPTAATASAGIAATCTLAR